MKRRKEPSTLPPPFDPAQFARDSDDALKAAPRVEPSSETRISPQPRALDDESWAASLVGTPRQMVPPSELRAHDLDPRIAFLLSLLDGVSDLETVVAASAMPRGEALCVLRSLMERGVVEMIESTHTRPPTARTK
jgi:hypothetical protein